MSREEVERCLRDFERAKSALSQPHQVRARRAPTHDYNCHGLTFLSRRAWLADDEAIDRVLADDGFREVELSEALPGDIVIYRYGNGRVEHTGVVVWVEENETVRLPWVVSKWGNLGEYIHRFNNSPYRGTAHFMRETPYDQYGADH